MGCEGQRVGLLFRRVVREAAGTRWHIGQPWLLRLHIAGQAARGKGTYLQLLGCGLRLPCDELIPGVGRGYKEGIGGQAVEGWDGAVKGAILGNRVQA